MTTKTRSVSFEMLLSEPLRNGLTKPKAIRGSGVRLINMGEVFAHSFIGNIQTDRAPVSKNELDSCGIMSGDLLFARQSLVLEGAGKCCFVTTVPENTVFESHLIRARMNHEIANPLFYYYFFSSRYGRKLMSTIVEQVSAAGIRGKDLRKLQVPLIPLCEQNKIASLLEVLDKKIKLNSRINDYLAA